MKILYTGPFRIGSLTESRRRALIELGHTVIGLDQRPYLDHYPGFIRKLQMHLLIGLGIFHYNRDIIRLSQRVEADMIYVDCGIYLWPETVKTLSTLTPKLVHYTSEWFGFRPYLYRYFVKSVPFYHAHVITFPPSKAWLEKRGARRVIMTEFGFDPHLHRPVTISPTDKEIYGAEVVFVGHWEPSTERYIVALRNAGIQVRVWGPGWHRARQLVDRKSIRPVWGEEYVKALTAAKICLCALSKWNNNRYSASRTFEIPAVGGFLLAERTEDHQRYFEEDKEAVFFSSEEELVEKARYYLTHEEVRLAIARAGHERCLRSPYTHKDRMRAVLEALG